MSLRYTIDQSRGLVRTVATGRLTADDLLRHKAALLRDRRFRPGMPEISDVRGVERLEIGPEDIRRLAARDEADADRLGDFRLAIVVSADLVYGMARMYQAMTEDHVPNVAVFRDGTRRRYGSAWTDRWIEPSPRRLPAGTPTFGGRVPRLR